MKRNFLWIAPFAALSFACEPVEGENVVVDETVSGVVAAGTNAAVVSHTIPASLLPGESRSVQVVIQNSGTVLWDNSDYQFRRPVVTGLVWSPQQIFNRQVAEGEMITFTFNITAPTTEGVYNFDARMYVGRRTGGGFFGETMAVSVNVSAAVIPDYDARLISNDAPASMNPGERRLVNIVMQNAGLMPWIPQEIELRPKGVVRSTRSRPVTTIGTGSNTNLPTYFYAPTTIGRYTYQMRLGRQDGTHFVEFGPSIDVPVVVGSANTLMGMINTQDDYAVINFTSAPANGSYECSLDGSAFQACLPPVGYRRLVQQEHTFRVRATVNGLVDDTPASFTWTSGSPAPAVGGDGFIEGGEQCDDANVLSGDGCSAVMQVEGGYSCLGQPSICMPSSQVFSQCDDGYVQMNLGFPFQFFASEAPVSTIYVSSNGRIFFSQDPYMYAWVNTALPTSAGNDFVAWWWDDLYFCDVPAAFSYSVIGSPPNRVARMIFSDVGLYPGRNPAAVLQAEVRLYEGSNTVQVDYGTNTIANLSANLGAENAQGVATMSNPFGCGTYCTSANWPANTTYTFPQQP